jgi:hypothetical protein
MATNVRRIDGATKRRRFAASPQVTRVGRGVGSRRRGESSHPDPAIAVALRAVLMNEHDR